MTQGPEVSGPQRGAECGECGSPLDLASPYRCVCRVSKTDDSGWAEWIRAYQAGETERGPATEMIEIPVEAGATDSSVIYPAPQVSSRDGVEPARGWPGPVALLASEADAAG